MNNSLDTFEKMRRLIIRVNEQFRCGILSAEEACQTFVRCVEPALAVECVNILPDELREALPLCLSKLPTTEDDWGHIYDILGIGQFDGNDLTWAMKILSIRTTTETLRVCVLGITSPPISSDFVDRLRAKYCLKRDKFLGTLRHIESNDHEH